MVMELEALAEVDAEDQAAPPVAQAEAEAALPQKDHPDTMAAAAAAGLAVMEETIVVAMEEAEREDSSEKEEKQVLLLEQADQATNTAQAAAVDISTTPLELPGDQAEKAL